MHAVPSSRTCTILALYLTAAQLCTASFRKKPCTCFVSVEKTISMQYSSPDCSPASVSATAFDPRAPTVLDHYVCWSPRPISTPVSAQLQMMHRNMQSLIHGSLSCRYDRDLLDAPRRGHGLCLGHPGNCCRILFVATSTCTESLVGTKKHCVCTIVCCIQAKFLQRLIYKSLRHISETDTESVEWHRQRG